MRRSFGSAFGLSAVTHGAIFLLVVYITARLPGQDGSPRPIVPPGSIVWMGGGGGGGGKRALAPPGRVEAPGHDRTTLPVRQAPPLEAASENRITPAPPVQALIDAVPTAAGLTEMPGVLTPAPGDAPSLGPGTGGGAGAGRRGGLGDGDGLGAGPGTEKNIGGGPYQPGTSGVSNPRLIREVVPNYTNGALQARIQGVVFMNAVVRADGTVGDVWVTRSLDERFGLDLEAVRAVKQWRFIPAMHRGRPVDVVVPIELRFTIH